jgi:hypothetical protein
MFISVETADTKELILSEIAGSPLDIRFKIRYLGTRIIIDISN